jgi:hypothetical protein
MSLAYAASLLPSDQGRAELVDIHQLPVKERVDSHKRIWSRCEASEVTDGPKWCGGPDPADLGDIASYEVVSHVSNDQLVARALLTATRDRLDAGSRRESAVVQNVNATQPRSSAAGNDNIVVDRARGDSDPQVDSVWQRGVHEEPGNDFSHQSLGTHRPPLALADSKVQGLRPGER